MVLPGPLPDGVDLGLVVVGEVRTGELDGGGGDEAVGGGLDMRDSDGDVRLPWKCRSLIFINNLPQTAPIETTTQQLFILIAGQ